MNEIDPGSHEDERESVLDSEELEENSDDLDDAVGEIKSGLIDALERTNLKGVTIFNIEDQRLISRANKRSFESLNATFRSVENGEEALEELDTLPDKTVIILDNDMGEGIKGVDLAPKIRERRPGFVIILTSGSLDSETLEKLQADDIIDGAFSKPYSARDLSRYVLGYFQS